MSLFCAAIKKDSVPLLRFPFLSHVQVILQSQQFIITPWRVFTLALAGGCPRGVMAKAMDCGIVVREFVLQSCYYVHFRANTLGKGMSPLILPAMG